VRASHGEEGIELKDGSRLNFVARSRTSGRGFSGDKLILDEAQEIDPEDIASSLPMLAARPNPQIIYAGTVNDSADHLRKVRDRAEVGDETRLAVTEFGSDAESDINDEAVWAAANPSYATRLDPEFVAMERKSMSDEAFRQERLGIWPPKASEVTVFPAGAWEACINLDSALNGLVVLAADAPPDRSEAYVTAAGLSDDSFHVEVIEAKRGLGWVSDFLIEKATRYNALVVIDGRSALGTIVPKLEQAGVKVYLMNAADVAKACGSFYDMVVEERLAHLDDPILNLAVFGASQRALGDAWAWDRKHALVAISPLIAATNALYGVQLQGAASGEPEVYFI
jgi:phage terminase large subunit-like protein